GRCRNLYRHGGRRRAACKARRRAPARTTVFFVLKMSDWLTWQIVDSAFPTGAFAHSWGLEAAWQQGEVNDLDALRAFLEASIQQAGYASLPLVNDAYRSPEQLEALDALADA